MAGPQKATFYPTRLSQYVPSLNYAADALFGVPNIVDFGAPAVSDSTSGLINKTVGTNATTFSTFTSLGANIPLTIADPFGRTIQCTGSTAGANQILALFGRDYLGQKMQDSSVTLSGTSIVSSLKAFKYLDKVTATAGTTGTALSVGIGGSFGLPYKASSVITEIVDNAKSTNTGTFVAGVGTNPQLTGSGDPRGTYIPSVSANSTKNFKVVFYYDQANLHGFAHVAA